MNMSMAAHSCWHCWHCPLSLEYKFENVYLFKQKEVLFFVFFRAQLLWLPATRSSISVWKDIGWWYLLFPFSSLQRPQTFDLSTDWCAWTEARAWWSFQPRVSLGTRASPNSSLGTRRLPNRKARARVGLPARSHRNQTGFIISKSWIWAESSKAIRPRFGPPLSFSSSPRGSIRTSMPFLDDSMYVLTLYSLFKYTETNTDTDSFQHQHYCNEKQLSCLFLILPNNKLQVQSCVFGTGDLAKQICFLICCD